MQKRLCAEHSGRAAISSELCANAAKRMLASRRATRDYPDTFHWFEPMAATPASLAHSKNRRKHLGRRKFLALALHRQSDVVFCQSLRGSARTGDVIEFGDLAA